MKKGFASIRFLAFSLALFALVAGTGAMAISSARSARETADGKGFADALLAAQARSLRAHHEELLRLRNALEEANIKIKEETGGLSARLKEEERLRRAAESARASEKESTQKKISELEKDLASAKSADLVAIIKKWRRRIAHIECDWQKANGQVLQKTGSGFLFGSDLIATSKHVVMEGGVAPNTCRIQFPDDPSFVVLARGADSGKIIADASEDFAWIQIKTPTAAMKNSNTLGSASHAIEALSCKRRALAGDPIVILGYPNIGSESDVTATEGIISGYESNYYVTSAKLEQGNSGGAAIAAKSDCYLGIPTFVRVGSIESLGRILDFAKIK